jgi:tetratricopeptide (TPR) repeat protein
LARWDRDVGNYRPQYLRIQAGHLAERFPLAALSLIDEYFETGDGFDVPNAFCVRAEACCALGKIDDAVAAYKRALAWEEAHPNHISTARMDLPRLVAERCLSSEYAYALDILATRLKPMDHQFPSTRYFWNGSNALILSELGRAAEAQEFGRTGLACGSAHRKPVPLSPHRRRGSRYV